MLPRQLSSLIWHFTCFTLFYLFHLVLLILPYFTCSRLGASLDYIPVAFMLSLKIKRIAQKVSVLDACPKEIGMVSIVVLALKALTKRWLHTLVYPYAKLTTKKYYLQKQNSQATGWFDSLGFLFSFHWKLRL